MLLHNTQLMKRKLKQWVSTISTNSNLKPLNQNKAKMKSRHMALDIQVFGWDRHNHITMMIWFIRSQPSSVHVVFGISWYVWFRIICFNFPLFSFVYFLFCTFWWDKAICYYRYTNHKRMIDLNNQWPPAQYLTFCTLSSNLYNFITMVSETHI